MDVGTVRRKYRRNAIYYNLVAWPLRRLRQRAVTSLGLRPGDTVLDLGCGTGLSLAPLRRAVGPEGHVIGVDVSPDMLLRARRLVANHRWPNVRLVEASADAAVLDPGSLDAVLCFYTHDIMQSQRAIERAVAALRPGGRVVAAGARRTTGLRALALNPLTVTYSRTAITNLEGFDRPWMHLEDRLGPLDVEEHFWGTAYIARGIKR